MKSSKVLGVLAAAMITASLLVTMPSAGAQATLTCNGRAATIIGTDGADVLRGTSGKDIIVGLGGDDQIFGFGGGDILCGGPGRDRVEGGPGKDLILGAGGGDWLFGGPGDDVVLGERGLDRVHGGRGADTVDGGIGVDRLYGDADVDRCVTDFNDVFLRSCEGGNYKQFTGTGDKLFRPRLTTGFVVAEQCFQFAATCDEFYVARVRLNGTGTFDALSVDAFNHQAETIASYGDAADQYGGVFMFGERPIQLQVDSGGGTWEVMFYEASGLLEGAATTSGTGNQVYFVKRPARGLGLSASVQWTGFGHFAVVAVAPSTGRDLLVNEVRFSGQGNPPFTAVAPAASNISIVQVLSDAGSWTVAIG